MKRGSIQTVAAITALIALATIASADRGVGRVPGTLAARHSGACCFPTGACAVLTPEACEEAGGRYQGDGAPCEPSTCPKPYACCLPDGTCEELTEIDCIESGGEYQGDGSDCELVECMVVCTGQIGDFIWSDDNGNGIQDEGEPGLEGVCLTLYRTLEHGELEYVADTCSDMDGYYRFTDLCADDYQLEVDPHTVPEGYMETLPNQGMDDELDSDCEGGMVMVTLPYDDSVDLSIDCGFVPPRGICLVIIDEDTIDNGISTIEYAAYEHHVEPDYLVNDDRPTEYGNPPLRWNEYFPGDVVLIPGGQVDDEGLFALPEDTPFSLADFAAGVVPQDRLDPVYDVMPIRNQDLFQMIGLTCVAVVYDSDISMNYRRIQGNLQGERYGLFTFTVLDVVVAGSIPESQSSTSLYDLLVVVESPMMPEFPYQVVIRDHEPDAAEIVCAEYDEYNGMLTVVGESDFAPYALMTVSIDGFVLEAEMSYNMNTGYYEYTVMTDEYLDGRRVSIQTDEGGAYNDFVE